MREREARSTQSSMQEKTQGHHLLLWLLSHQKPHPNHLSNEQQNAREREREKDTLEI